jgi:hypothetical protein
MAFDLVIGGVTYTFNQGSHLATQGYLDEAIGIATLGEVISFPTSQPGTGVSNVPPNNIGSLISDPRREWYVRENAQDPLHGPLSFTVADKHARWISSLEDRSGLAEVVTFVSNTSRGGDPSRPNPNPRLFVVFLYIEGKRTLGGRAAQFHSDRGLPPTT